jgi:uncharacterized repeat protein (TIGR03803 family)
MTKFVARLIKRVKRVIRTRIETRTDEFSADSPSSAFCRRALRHGIADGLDLGYVDCLTTLFLNGTRGSDMKATPTRIFAGTTALLFLSYLSPAEASTATVLHSFCVQQGCPDGGLPQAGLLDENGLLYGTATIGGANISPGALFSIDPHSGVETVIYSFGFSGDGQNPDAGVISFKGKLYGTTTQGGAYDYGSVFSFDLTTGEEKILHSFNVYSQDAIYPSAELAVAKSELYGMTYQGGVHELGAIYAVDPKTGSETVAYSFPGSAEDGYSPSGRLLNVRGLLYGTTNAGGANREGTVFSFNPATGTETVLYSFCYQQGCTDGGAPNGDLIEKSGKLYGTTYSGGAYGGGTVFSLDLISGTETVLHSFCAQTICADGGGPSAGLLEADGTLYGTTIVGGTSGDGTVFSLDPVTGVETVLYAFDGNAGEMPNGSLIKLGNALYGTSPSGGAHISGTVFKIKR